ncbi:MAG: SRPBCC family protein [Actinomycetota bacterium]|nr:SRPBCC family protein [Actinomycetota bacterium]
MADGNRPYRVGYEISGIGPERIFAALLDVGSFPEWAVGLAGVRALDADGRETARIQPGTNLEFVLEAAGLTHTVVSEITAVEPPRLLEWRYVRGATGSGGWRVERSGANTVKMTLATDYGVRPAWLDRIAHRPFFRRLTEDLLRRSIRRFEQRIRQT